MAGKGDWRRPSRVSQEELDERWEKAFGKKRWEGEADPLPLDETVFDISHEEGKPDEDLPKPQAR